MELIGLRNKVGFWYRCLKLLGESTSFSLGRVDSENEWMWQDFDHEQFDGLGGVQTYFKQHFQYELELPKLRKEWGSPRFFNALIGAINYQKSRELPFIEWKHRDFSNGLSFSNTHKKIATLLITPEESKLFLSKLKDKKLNFNAYCMKQFTDFLRSEFLTSEVKDCLWQFPVNMRGHVPTFVGDLNQSSYVDIVVYESDSPDSIRNEMMTKFNKKEHWFVWYGAKFIPKLFPKAAFKTVQEHILIGGPPYLGNFSNLGSFEIPNCHEAIYLATPTTRVRPIGFGTMSVNGHLTFTLQFHETLPVAENFQEKFDKFKKSLVDV